MEYGTASNFSLSRQNHTIGPDSSTDTCNEVICYLYWAQLFRHVQLLASIVNMNIVFFFFSRLHIPFISAC